MTKFRHLPQLKKAWGGGYSHDVMDTVDLDSTVDLIQTVACRVVQQKTKQYGNDLQVVFKFSS